MITNRALWAIGACLGLVACGATSSPQPSYTMDDCRRILADARKPGTVEDATRRQAERTCANIVGAPPAAGRSGDKPTGAASAPRAG